MGDIEGLVMDAALIFALPLALAVGLWWLARATDRHSAEQDAVVRRTYTEDMASSPWIRRKAREIAEEPPDVADDAEASDVILELEETGGFRVPEKPFYQRQSNG
jgi:hypothetical protein